MLGELYNPKALALETAMTVLGTTDPAKTYAVNIAKNCENDCGYCYVPYMTYAPNPAMAFPKEDPVKLIEKQLNKGIKPEGVFLCFITDPLHPKNRATAERVVKFLHEQGVKKIATLSKIGIVDAKVDEDVIHGMTVVSIDEAFWQKYENRNPLSPTTYPEKRLGILEMRKYMEGNKVFVSMEPSPVDGIFKQDFGNLLSKMTFVDLIIFGMWNYKDEGRIAKLPESIAQYKQNIQTLREFGARNNIKIHIKSDTLRAIGELPPKSK